MVVRGVLLPNHDDTMRESQRPTIPALNARPDSQVREWLTQIEEVTAVYFAANPGRPAAPYAVNQIVHGSNDTRGEDIGRVDAAANWAERRGSPLR